MKINKILKIYLGINCDYIIMLIVQMVYIIYKIKNMRNLS
jgi:hypothetical protein